ncbi:MAG: hypothetical protein QF531_01405 [Candidatus Poseidonia sp.]|jgi:hypothetical protein|nr:hypothetical protein [Poseidonia sp.]
MANLWQFFGLPDPEGNAPAQRRAPPAPAADNEPVALTGKPADEPSPPTTLPEPTPVKANPAARRTPPLGWSGPLTPDGEPFHDLGVVTQRPAPHPDKALRYIAPDEMKRIPTQAMLKRVIQGDTAIVDLRPLVHMDSHQMACRREIKHTADQARVSVFALDTEDKLLMVPGVNVVVDMQKHELGLKPLL